MAWNKDDPIDAVKLRVMPSEIRANWLEIEENDTAVKANALNQWSIHLIDRATISGINTPTRIDDVGMVFCKNDGTNNEMFFQDSQDPAKEVQLTSDGAIGGATTTLQLSSFSYTANMLPTALAVVPTAGTSYTREVNFDTVSKGGTGQYTLITDAVFTNANVFLSITPDAVSGNSATAMIDATVSIAASVLTIKVKIRNKDGNDVNAGFHVIVHGGIV